MWRDGLFAKLNHMGFGGRVLSLITSMYASDRIQFDVNGKLTSPLWLTQGVKQGTPFILPPLYLSYDQVVISVLFSLVFISTALANLSTPQHMGYPFVMSWCHVSSLLTILC